MDGGSSQSRAVVGLKSVPLIYSVVPRSQGTAGTWPSGSRIKAAEE